MIELFRENIHVLIPALVLALICLSWYFHRKWQRETRQREKDAVRQAVALTEREYTDADRRAYEAAENRRERREAA